MVTVDWAEVFKEFKGKRVFITGHTGFKGSWLTYILLNAGAHVSGISLDYRAEPNHFDLLGLSGKMDHCAGDIRDGKLLQEKLFSAQPEFVFHLAAQALVGDSYREPENTFSSNIMGSVNLLESVRLCDSVRSLIFVTSDKCYENVEWLWGYRENDRLGGYDPYSASKAAAEIVFSAYQRSFFEKTGQLQASSVRAGNVIGGGDWSPNRIIPDCIKSIKEKKTITLRNPKSTRPWQHVLEPLSGYLLLSAKMYRYPSEYSGSWNFGPETKECLNVYEVARTVVEHFGEGSIDMGESNAKHHEAKSLQLNCDKANHQLGWFPRWDTKTALAETAVWYKRYFAGEELTDITLSQIRDYFGEVF